MSKKKFAVKLISAACLVALLCCFTILALSAGTAGTTSDPLVTLSYVNKTFRESLLAEVQQRVNESAPVTNQQIAALADSFAAQVGRTAPQASETAYSAVNVPEGESYQLFAGQEFLVLSGGAKVSVNMLVDTTTGKSLAAGDAVAENHFFTCPADCQIRADSALRILIK